MSCKLRGCKVAKLQEHSGNRTVVGKSEKTLADRASGSVSLSHFLLIQLLRDRERESGNLAYLSLKSFGLL